MREIPYMMANTREEFERVRNLAWPAPAPSRAEQAVIDRFGIFDAPDVWDGHIPPGGFVCGACGQPTESEPCLEHQPDAASR